MTVNVPSVAARSGAVQEWPPPNKAAEGLNFKHPQIDGFTAANIRIHYINTKE